MGWEHPHPCTCYAHLHLLQKSANEIMGGCGGRSFWLSVCALCVAFENKSPIIYLSMPLVNPSQLMGVIVNCWGWVLHRSPYQTLTRQLAWRVHFVVANFIRSACWWPLRNYFQPTRIRQFIVTILCPANHIYGQCRGTTLFVKCST
jgi:hypothetical protein